MKAVISRRYGQLSTIGKLVIFDGEKIIMRCSTIELPDNGNQVNVSCIPEGKYQVTKVFSPKHGKCFMINDVPDRTAILIHKGNYTKDTQGCVIVGMYHVDLNKDGQIDVGDSTTALNRMLTYLPEKFELWII